MEKEVDYQNNKIVLITRTWCNKDIKQFIENIHKELSRIIVLVNFEKEFYYYTQILLREFDDNIFNKIEIYYVKPWGFASGALNIGLTKAFNHKKKPNYILIASSEVTLNENNIKKMYQELSKRPNMLVIGYALEAYTEDNSQFKGCEKGHIFEDSHEIYRIPWNTCAMWNAENFSEYIGTFNILCDCPEYLGIADDIRLRGMEDALAMAYAQRINPKLEIGIIRKPLPWKIKKEKLEKHKEKMKRKQLVYKKYLKKFKLNSIKNIEEFN